jgi:D-lactate dehydrogenase (cytochrome)
MAEPFLATLRAMADVTVVEAAHEMQPHLVDWRKRHFGKAQAVVFPGTVDAVAAIIRQCAERRVPVYPQGGNTSVCGGSVPDERGDGIVLNLRRMNLVRRLDADDNSMVVEAGCVLAAVQEAARNADRLFPMSLGAEGSCQIGGNIATNAGGTAVVRYGNMRDLVLGLEAVLPDGTVWNGLRTLRKNNSGYDLKNLFIGSEGTLGVVTAAALKLFPLPRHTITAFVALALIEDAAALACEVQTQFPGLVSAIELVSASEMELVIRHVPGTVRPLATAAPWYALVEISGSEQEAVMAERLGAMLEPAMVTGSVLDATIATSERQRRQLWHIRHHVTEANVKEGMGITHDIAVPPASVARFVQRAEAALAVHFPQATPVIVGHLGDGNIHYIAMFPHVVWAGIPDKAAVTASLNHMLYDIAAELGGTFSAEHGVGSIHVDDMDRYKPAAELALMRTIKKALDPLGIMNPGRVLSNGSGATSLHG